MRARAHTVPLRRCLALALVAIVVAPALATWGIAQALTGWQQHAGQARWANVRAAIGGDVARWHDPAWQRKAGVTFAALGVEVGLVDKQPRRGGLAFASPGGRRLMDALGLAPSNPGELTPSNAGGKEAAKRANAAARDEAANASLTGAVTYRPIAIMARATPTGRAPVAGVANVWFVRPLAASPPSWIAPAGGLATLVVALGIVAAFLNRAVLRPLSAMSRAARLVADGNLDLRLSSSAVSEVAEMTAALELMSGELREAARRQAGLEQERRLFIGAIAHDLRTPLFTLSAYLSGLRDGVAATPEKAAHYLAVCREQTAQLEHLVADLFAFATVEYLEQEPRREPVEVGQLLRRAVESVEPRAASSGISVIVTGPAATCTLLADARSLTRVIENLLDNALRYTPGGGRVEVRWWSDVETGSVHITVEDTGPGLAMADIPHLFTPLYRGDASRHQHTGGAGLGLAIARRIMQAHGGDLTAANTPAGGALFTATLPGAQSTKGTSRCSAGTPR